MSDLAASQLPTCHGKPLRPTCYIKKNLKWENVDQDLITLSGLKKKVCCPYVCIAITYRQLNYIKYFIKKIFLRRGQGLSVIYRCL